MHGQKSFPRVKTPVSILLLLPKLVKILPAPLQAGFFAAPKHTDEPLSQLYSEPRVSYRRI